MLKIKLCPKCSQACTLNALYCGKCKHDFKEMNREYWLNKADNYLKAKKVEDAANILEELHMWEEAGEVRSAHQEQSTTVQHQIIADHIDMSTNTDIRDSVMNRSPIGAGAGSEEPFTICPYCGKTLNLPNTPKYCPYCEEQLRM